jgi:recombination protein RecA
MSSAVVSTSAALGRPFLFDAESEPEVRPLSGDKKPADNENALITQVFQSTINNHQSPIPSFGNRKSAMENSIRPASRLEVRPAPEMVSSGISELDALTGGLPRGCLTEIFGPASSGRTSMMLATLAAATRRGEYCAVIDASDALDPQSIAAAGVNLDRLLWVRCNENSPRRHRDAEKTNEKRIGKGTASVFKPALREQGDRRVPYDARNDAALAVEGRPFHLQETFFEQGLDRSSRTRNFNSDEDSRNRKHSERRLEQVLRATDLLLESGGFGLIVLDLAGITSQAARRIPLTTWFRFRRTVEHKPTILLAIEQQPIAGSCSSLLLQLKVPSSQLSVLSSNQSCKERDIVNSAAKQAPKPSHAQLLTELKINAELVRSRLDRKPARSITFETKTAWAG